MKILIIGDIYSNSGRLMVEKYLPKVREKYNINFIVANGENIAHGNGITERYYHFLLDQYILNCHLCQYLNNKIKKK